MTHRTLHLNAFLQGTGHHEASWRAPGTSPGTTLTAQHYIAFAQTAERGRFDSIFFADSLAVQPDLRHYTRDHLEPTTLLAAIAMATTSIGLIATASTSYLSPFDLARRFASLDHISGGRVGWNIVTSALQAEAENFVDDRADHDDRYARAAEFLDVVLKLWDSWDDDARVLDKESGLCVDSDRVHAIEHVGERFRVRGPLNVPRPIQGHPLLVQAGGSEAGRQYAAEFADAVFTPQASLESSVEFAADMRRRATEFGRDPEQLTILPGLMPVIGSTRTEAERKLADLNDLISPEYGVAQLSRLLEFDLSGADLDAPLPSLPAEHGVQGGKTRFANIVKLARDERLTVRELVIRLTAGYGHHVVTGTAIDVADRIEEWFRAGACDGFNLMPATLPESLDDFVDQVVPELQRRGLFRLEYDGRTLRQNYGLQSPSSARVRV